MRRPLRKWCGGSRSAPKKRRSASTFGKPFLIRQPRSVYVVAALALVASSLFALRYGLSRRLDLSPPLARMVQDQFTPADKKEVAENRHRTPPGKDDADTTDSPTRTRINRGRINKRQTTPRIKAMTPAATRVATSKDKADKPNGGDQQQQDGQGQNQQADERDQQQDSGQQSSSAQGESKGDSKQQADGKQSSNNSAKAAAC